MPPAAADGGGMAAAAPRRLVVSALGFAQILAWGSSYYLPAVLAQPIAAATGWAYAWVIGGLSLGLLVSGLVAIHVGRAIDRHGGRPVLAASALLLAAGLAMLAAAPNLLGYLGAWVVIGCAMGAGLYDAAFSALGRLYGSAARRAITGLTLWGGFASTVCWPLSALLVETVGWRGTCLVYAGLQIAVVLPLYVWMLPRRAAAAPSPPPAAAAPGAAAAPTGRRPLAVGLLMAIVTAGGIISAAWSVHLLAMLQASGLALAAAVALGALVGPAQVGARVIEMLAGTRYHPIWTLAASAILIAVGLALLWAEFPVPAAALISYGAGNGIWSIARGTLPLALFGPAGYATLMGRLAMPGLIAQSAAPLAGALMIESLGARAALAALLALATANVLVVAVLWQVAVRRPAARARGQAA